MKTRLEVKVGWFVFVGFVLVALLLIGFGKGTNLFRPTYTILLHAADVVGLQKNADVLMAGVKVGSVDDITLAPGGKSVTMELRIYRDFVVHKDATFRLEQSGFLGDQYVAIQPNENKEPPFADMGEATAVQPFSISAAARTATGFIQRLDQSVTKLDDALDQVRRLVLNGETLTNLSDTIANLRQASEKASFTLGRINTLLATNEPVVNASGSNLLAFSEQMNLFGTALNDVVRTNSGDLNQAIRNVEASTDQMNALLTDVRSGKGLAGALVQDEQLPARLTEIVNNLSITTSNLNRLGLWGILWKKKMPSAKEQPVVPLESPKASAN